MIRKFLFTFGLLAVLSGPSLAHARVANILGNPGFEDVMGVGANWNNDANRGIIQRQAADAPEGRYYLRLDESTTVAGSVGVFTFQIQYGVKPGDLVGFSGLVRVNSLDAGKAVQLRIEFKDSNNALLDSVDKSINAVTPAFSLTSVSKVAPAGTSMIAFVLRIQPSAVGGGSQADFDVMKGTINGYPVELNAGTAGSSQSPGDAAIISTKILNVGADALTNLELVVTTPQGGLSINREHASLDGQHIDQREGSVIFNLGNFSGGQESLFAFAAIVSSGVTAGKQYEIHMFVRSGATKTSLSDVTRLYILIEPDPLFNLGTIIGKVFNDLNGNGMQDKGEKGIPNVRLATEQGVVVYTDRYGKYHIPGVVPGRHLVKADFHSLPEGTTFVTEESYLVKITDGLLAKVNFAVKLPENEIPAEYQNALTAQVVQELDQVKPQLSVETDAPIVRTGQGMLERPVKFKICTNYGPMIKEWKIEIHDEVGEEIWVGVGKGAPPAEVEWDGKDNSGNLIEPGDYAFRLIVTDQTYNEDWTPLAFFRVESKLNRWKNGSPDRPYSSVGYFNIMSDGKRSIPFSGITALRVYGRTPTKNQVLVNQQAVSTDKEGFFETSILAPNGTQKVEVTTTTESGESLSYQKEVKIKENYLFMVALGEEEMGVSDFKGNVEAIGTQENFRDGFYHEGRIAYYLKGKIKGKFLITSSYDNQNKKSKLFTNLDPDKYYPVYGDASKIIYDAGETQDGFYVLVEKDRSFFKWGSFNTDFKDTELATHNRTMSGGKVHFETVTTTRYGTPKSSFTSFYSKQKQEADHNEFLGTGGSLYYLKNKRVVEGSEKVRVETRDKLTGIVRSQTDLASGQDYEIDYSQGRIILARPLFSVNQSDTIINQAILDGNDNVLVVDYEYEAPDTLGYSSLGLRGYHQFGDYVKVGATYLDDMHPPNDRHYSLPAIDTAVNVGMNTKITAEYAESQNSQLQGAYSDNGGMSFYKFGSYNMGANQEDKKRPGAYVIRVQSRPFKPLDVSGYVQHVYPEFSNADTGFSQEAQRKYGVEANYRIAQFLIARYRNDNLQQLKKESWIGEVDSSRFHTAQLVYDDGKILGIAEYRHSIVSTPEESRRIDSLFSVNNFGDAAGLKLGYRVNENYMPYVRGQATFNDGGKSDNQMGVGIEAKLLDKSKVSVEENFGKIGDSTQVRFETKTSETTTAYANVKMGNGLQDGRGVQTTLGSSHNLNNHSRLFTEKEYSEYHGENYARNIMGYERTFLDNKLGANVTVERNDLNRAKAAGVTFEDIPVLANAFTTGLSYNDGNFIKAQTRWEYRRFTASEQNGRQWLVYNNLGIQVTKDIEFFGRFNMSKSRDLNLGNTWADFVELNTGFSFRPVDWDRLNFLTRYTYLSDALPYDRFGNNVPYQTSAHIAAFEGGYDLNRYFQLVEKVAFKLSQVETSFGDNLNVYNYLWVNRLNYHLTRKWDLGLEYRILAQQGAGENYRHGVLAELDRELFDYTRIGVGYNFTDFDDDLRRKNSFQSYGRGPFVRLTGKF